MDNIKSSILRILDTGKTYYELSSDSNILGRRFDNNAWILNIETPKDSAGNELDLDSEIHLRFFTPFKSEMIDHIIIDRKTPFFIIKNNISQFSSVTVGVSFENSETNYLKNSDIITLRFLNAEKPQDFIPSTPNDSKINTLWTGAVFSGSITEEENEYIYYNQAGTELFKLPIPLAKGDMEKSTYDTENRKTDIFKYVDDLVAEVVGDIGIILANINNNGGF